MTRPLTGLATNLREHQHHAVSAVCNEFELGAPRGLVVMPCGTGKTIVALCCVHLTAAEGRSLVVTPTLDLLNQTAREWNTHRRPGTYIALCSDPVPRERALRGTLQMTRTPQALAEAVRKAPHGPINVFTTYASLQNLAAAHRLHGLPRWDIAVVDEAHRTSGDLGKKWGVIHDDDAIPARHRLYMTATPRVWDVNATLGSEPIASMDDQALYGRRVYSYSLAQAIADLQLADYRICAPVIRHKQLRDILRHTNRDDPTADPMRVSGAILALLQAREEHRIRRPLVFSRTIDQAVAFAEDLYTVAEVTRHHTDGLWVSPLHCRQSIPQRRDRISRFAEPIDPNSPYRYGECNILCNCRLAVEGLDFPAADAILFSQPKTSTIEIVQAVGRSLRLTPGTHKTASLIIPVFFGPNESPETATYGTPYHLLHQVMIAMRAFDEHIFDRLFSKSSTALHTRLPVPRAERAADIARQLALRTMTPHDNIWLESLEAAALYAEQHGHLDVPGDYVDPDGRHLGAWIDYQRSLKAAGNLDPTRVTALAVLGMTWEHPPGSPERFLALARAYTQEHGHLLPHPQDAYQNEPLGAWLEQQRAHHDAGTLADRHSRTLTSIHPHWNPPWDHDWQRSYAQALLRSRRGALAVPVTQAQADTDPTTTWIDQQFDCFPRLRRLQRDQLGLLLEHDPLALAFRRARTSEELLFAEILRAARKFRRRNHHLHVPARHIETLARTPFPLGMWLEHLRQPGALAHLTRTQLDALQALDMEFLPGLSAEDSPVLLQAS